MGTVTALPIGQMDEARYVRVTNRSRHGFVEFQFSIGDPSLYLEMTLPPKAFAEFCKAQNVRMLGDEESAVVDAQDRRWRYGDEQEES